MAGNNVRTEARQVMPLLSSASGGTTISSGITTTTRPAAISTFGTQAAGERQDQRCAGADDFQADAGAVIVHHRDSSERRPVGINRRQPDQVGEIVFIFIRAAAARSDR